MSIPEPLSGRVESSEMKPRCVKIALRWDIDLPRLVLDVERGVQVVEIVTHGRVVGPIAYFHTPTRPAQWLTCIPVL